MALKSPGSRLRAFARRFTSAVGNPIIHIPSESRIFEFGQANLPVIRDLSWLVEDGQAWAVVSGSGGGKDIIFKALLGHARVSPPPASQIAWTASGGLYPFLAASSVDPYTKVASVSFRQRSDSSPGMFFDYTARYGALRDAEDRVTLRKTLEQSLHREQHILYENLLDSMKLTPLLDLPLLTLSNGQTRRARIVRAILTDPKLLLLDEPLTGLDPRSRESLNSLLQRLHGTSSPRIIIGLRKGEEIPPWITHILDVKQGTAVPSEIATFTSTHTLQQPQLDGIVVTETTDEGPLVADIRKAKVAYGDRTILNDITWTIRQGERWHLQGPNGSGKTTLLALLTGDHPQSYTQDHLQLPSFSGIPQSRHKTPTAYLRRLIGVVSPEMFDAFPRKHPGMSVWEAIGTGFDGGFVPRTRDASKEARRNGSIGWVDVSDEELALQTPEMDRSDLRSWRIQRCWDVLENLGPSAWANTSSAEFASRSFSSLSPGEQRIVLLMRALVGKPPLVILDEAWSGMDDAMISAARRYLRGGGVDHTQAVIVVTHWVDEVPWTLREVKTFRLD